MQCQKHPVIMLKYCPDLSLSNTTGSIILLTDTGTGFRTEWSEPIFQIKL